MTDPVANKRLIVIGLDAATWTVINPLLRQGQLPHMARLIQNGTSGTLRSLEPMISTMLWTSISSGKLPDQHGVRDFAISSRAVRCKRLWDIFADHGLRVGVYGHLITWPPDPVPGFMVPGSFAPGPETHPPEVEFLKKLTLDEKSGGNRRYSARLGYGIQALRNGVRPSTMARAGIHMASEALGRTDRLLSAFQKRALQLQLDCDVFCDLFKKFEPHFAIFYTHLVDSTQHWFWKYREPEAFGDVDPQSVARYGQVIAQAYREADRAVGQILSTTGDDVTVMIVSDHGAQAAVEGAERAVWTIRTENLLRMLGLENQVRAVNLGRDLYLSPKDEVPEAKANVIQAFESIVTEEGGVQVFEAIPLEQFFVKIHTSKAMVQQLQGATVKVRDTRCPFEEILEVSTHRRISANHHPDGICILWGKSIRQGGKLGEAGLLDIAPTVLMLMGFPLAKDMPGRPLQEAVSEPFLKTQPIRYVDTYEDGGRAWPEEVEDVSLPPEVVDRLKALGYLG